MRIESTVTSVSWIPSESLAGAMARSFDLGVTHYDEPPPDVLSDASDVQRLRDEDRFRFANVLAAWADVQDGQVVASGFSPGAGIVTGSTTLGIGKRGLTFQGFSLPVLQFPPEADPASVRFTQTVGCRTAVPLPRPVPHPPFVQWQAPLVWTTLTLTLFVDGRAEVGMPGGSAFPRHWVYGPDGALALKSGLTDQANWVAHSFGARTPWGEHDSEVLVTAVESELERQLSHQVMRAGRRPEVRQMAAGSTLVRQGETGDELFLLLDGVLGVEVDGERLAEVGPGAVLGERALLEGGNRTSTLVALTAARVAVAAADAIDTDRLHALAQMHRREDTAAPDDVPE